MSALSGHAVIYDNMKTIVKEGWGKYVASEQRDFAQLKAHYAFATMFCNPGKGNEKGLVENLVGWVQKNLFVPMIKADSYREINEGLIKRCLAYQNHTIRGRSRTVGEMFEIEKSKLTALPKRDMEPIRQVLAKANHFSTVAFDGNRYSVPVKYIGSDITVKAGVFEVYLWHRGQLVAQHPRIYEKNAVSYQLEHYLPLLEQKSRAVWNAQPVRHTNLPDSFWDFAKRLACDYEVVKLLKLTAEYGIPTTVLAIQKAVDHGAYCYEGVLKYLERQDYTTPVEPPADLFEIRQVDLRDYDNIASGG
jgi:hypothetical protein